MARELDRKEYEVRIYREGTYIGDLGRIARSLKWTVNRNPHVGYDKITFIVDQFQFKEWCDSHHVDARTLITKTKTDCKIRVRNSPQDDWVYVAWGYLYKDPTISKNNEAFDLNFEFIDYMYKLSGVLIPNGQRWDNYEITWIIWDMLDKIANQQGHFGFTTADNPRMGSVTRQYDDWKPVSEAISDMLDNETGAGQFDIWFDENMKYHAARKRGRNSGLRFYYPYSPAQGDIPISDISYEDPPEFATRILATGEGQGDPVTATAEDQSAIDQYGYVTAYVQFSSITDQGTLNYKAQAELSNRLHPDPAPEITVPGKYLDWSTFGVGDQIHFTNDAAVFYGLGGDVRVKTIEVSTDENRAETVKLTCEATNG